MRSPAISRSRSRPRASSYDPARWRSCARRPGENRRPGRRPGNTYSSCGHRRRCAARRRARAVRPPHRSARNHSATCWRVRPVAVSVTERVSSAPLAVSVNVRSRPGSSLRVSRFRSSYRLWFGDAGAAASWPRCHGSLSPGFIAVPPFNTPGNDHLGAKEHGHGRSIADCDR